MKTIKTALKRLSKPETKARRVAMKDINDAYGRAHNIASHNASMMFIGAL